MIDPSNIIPSPINKEERYITYTNIQECDMDNVYDLFDEKDFKKYISDVERDVRTSFEYRRFIRYLRENLNMNECSFLENMSEDGDLRIKIEQHHYPFTLYDICLIVLNKRMYYHECIDIPMIAKEVCILHYYLIVGLIPLSETVHELVHKSYIFIPIDKVVGRYNVFVEYYEPFMIPEQLDILHRIEQYSKEYDKEENTRVIQQNNIKLNLPGSYKMPELNNIADKMFRQIKEIKENGYRLPVLEENTSEKSIELIKLVERNDNND